MLVLAIDPGGRLRSYGLFRNNKPVVSMNFVIEGSSSSVKITSPDASTRQKLTAGEAKHPLSFFFIWSVANGYLASESDIDLVGVRIAAPGAYFQKDRPLTDSFVNNLATKKGVAPSHVAPSLKEIQALRKHLPATRVIAVSDSFFHSTISIAYPLPRQDVKNHGFRKYGFYGISAMSVLEKVKKQAGRVYDKTIICDLGSESSVSTVLKSRSIDTSSDYTPLSGLPSRNSSNVRDDSVAIELQQIKKSSPLQIRSYLMTKAGLAGMSGSGGDIAKLFELKRQGHQASKETLAYFSSEIKKSIGAGVATMNGLDMLVFTGSDGLNSAALRKLVCTNMESLGVYLDTDKNRQLNGEGFVNKPRRPGIAIIESETLIEIASRTVSYS